MSTLNVDTLANELGTGGPDFVGMPTVQGDPVVESGSNSDGGWVRWADGTQECFLNSSRGVIDFVWTFPEPFNGAPENVSVTPKTTSEQIRVGQAGEATTTQVPTYLFTNADTGSASAAYLSAAGRWK